MDDGPSAGTIRFREIRDTDLEVLHRLHGDPATNEHNPFGASPDRAATARMAREWIDHVRIHGFGYRLAVNSSSAAVGVGGARVDVWRGTPVVNLYWRLLPEYWGRGLAHPLAALAAAEARSSGGGDPIVARMLPANTASARVAERLGLQRRPDLDGVFAGAEWILYADRPR